MRSILLFFVILSILFAGCRMGTSVGGRSGGVSVGTSRAGTTVGIGTGTGFAVSYSSYGDFLYSGNNEAYANNKKGLKAFLAKDYPAAANIFQTTLAAYPDNPDATYYLGLTNIFLNEREKGYALLSNYRDSLNNRIASEVRWWAGYCRKKPELTAEKVYRTMNKARSEGYQRQQQEDWEDRRW